MAQLDCTDEDSWSSSSLLSNLQSYFGESHPVNDLISRIHARSTGDQLSSGFPLEDNNVQQDTEGLDDSRDSPKQVEDCRPPSTDISAALRSVALMGTLNLKTMHCTPKLLEEEDPAPLDDLDKSTEEAADPHEEESLTVSFQSKFIDCFPLYQDYCLQAVKDDLHRLSKSFVSELMTPQSLQGLHLEPRLYTTCNLWVKSPRSNPPEVTPSSPPPPSSPSLPHPAIRVKPCTLWRDLEEVKASGLLSILTTRELRLQETKFELIGSEASYLRSLGVAVNHFYASNALKQTLKQMEHHILFSNIRRVMGASEKFLMDLESGLGESVLMSQVGDIVLQHCPEFQSLYVPYVTNMMYQETLVNQLLQQNRDFLYSVKKLESDPVCQKQSLKSFLVLPFQRITRIKLILGSILKLTEPGSDSISNLEKAIEAVHEIVTECDRGVQKMKQIEELVSLETLLDFGKFKSIPLVVSGRYLVHQGPMKQLTVSYNSKVSFSSVYLHLFNDLLIISSKKWVSQRFTVLDHAEFPTHVHVEHLKTEVLGLPPDSFLLHLSQSHSGQPAAWIFVAPTRSSKEAWMKALLSKQ